MTSLEYETIEEGEGVRERQEEAVSWCQHHHPIHNTRKLVTFIAAVLLSAGLATMILGYVIPRDHEFDPSLPARRMEREELYHARLAFALDMCIVTGMGMIALGGLMVSSVTMYALVTGEEEKVYRQKDRQDLKLLDCDTTQQSSYGTAEDAT